MPNKSASASPSPPSVVAVQKRDAQLAKMRAALNNFFADPEVQTAAQAFGQAVKEAAEKTRPILAFLESALIFGAAMVEQMPGHLQKALSELNNRGWFYDAEMPLLRYWNLKSESAAKGRDIDAMMADHFESRLDDIERKLSAKLPNRASKLAPAFAAHRRGDFDLAILAFFAQTDGVSKELRGGYFFLNDRKGKPQTAGYAERLSIDELARIAHAALTRDLPIKQKLWSRSGSELNRHAVMHGQSIDHDTRENSLRALSLLNYIALGVDTHSGSGLAMAKATTLGALISAAPSFVGASRRLKQRMGAAGSPPYSQSLPQKGSS